MRTVKFTPREVADGLLDTLRPTLEIAIRASLEGSDPRRALVDLMDLIAADMPRYRAFTVASPYESVPDTLWREAYMEAARVISEREGADREPTRDEVDYALKTLRDFDDRRFA